MNDYINGNKNNLINFDNFIKFSSEDAKNALFYIPCSTYISDQVFTSIGKGFKFYGGDLETFIKWNNLAENPKSKDECKSLWDSFNLELSPEIESSFKYAHDEFISNRKSLTINKEEYDLDIEFADQLSEECEMPDEIVEGILTSGDGSILYGDSNCGKTFFVIDMCCSLSRGIDFLGRKTEKGMVIYLAAESPASVKRRLQIYQKHYGVKVPNFAIVKNPINLFGDEDTDKIIQLVRILEKQRGIKVRLVVGDTLSRLSAGANENAGTDMGVVIKHFDRIRSECNTHFMLIHHCGKNAAAGARGWSGVRAAVETEIEVTDSEEGKCAEITKQRDLDSKGDRIGFSLKPIDLGFKTKFGKPATGCIVLSDKAPKKQKSKKPSASRTSILEFLIIKKEPVRKSEIHSHFEGRISRSTIFEQLKNMQEENIISMGMEYVKLLNNYEEKLSTGSPD